MRRRDFIGVFAGLAAITWPLAAQGQQQTPLVGFLNGQTAAGFTHLVAAFKQGLNETGFFEGQNVTIEYRWADQHFDRLPELAADLVRRQPAVLVGRVARILLPSLRPKQFQSSFLSAAIP